MNLQRTRLVIRHVQKARTYGLYCQAQIASLPGAISVPLEELGKRLTAVRKDRRIVV